MCLKNNVNDVWLHTGHPEGVYSLNCDGCLRESKKNHPPGNWHDGSGQTTEEEAWLNRAVKIGRQYEKDKDPSGKSLKEPGTKGDANKIPVVRGALHYFPRAIAAVAELSAIGAKKYSWKGWEKVPDGINRYGDALGRHELRIEDNFSKRDPDTSVLEVVAVAWNALARAELVLREEEKCQPGCYLPSRHSTVQRESTKCGTGAVGGGDCSGSVTLPQMSRGYKPRHSV